MRRTLFYGGEGSWSYKSAAVEFPSLGFLQKLTFLLMGRGRARGSQPAPSSGQSAVCGVTAGWGHASCGAGGATNTTRSTGPILLPGTLARWRLQAGFLAPSALGMPKELSGRGAAVPCPGKQLSLQPLCPTLLHPPLRAGRQAGQGRGGRHTPAALTHYQTVLHQFPHSRGTRGSRVCVGASAAGGSLPGPVRAGRGRQGSQATAATTEREHRRPRGTTAP